jgi:hypothetical protein
MSLIVYTAAGLVKLASSSTGTDTNVASITETSHGFAIKDVVSFNGSNWVKADANNSLPAHAVVTAVPDVDTFTAAVGGFQTIASHGFTLGQNYLSETAGAVTTTLPGPGSIQQNVLIANTANQIFINLGEGLT